MPFVIQNKAHPDVFPIRDHNPSGKVPYVTYALIFINVAVFIAYVALLSDEQATFGIFDTYALVPEEVMRGEAYFTFITSMFMHGGWLHLIGNMLFLWIFGDNMEDAMGHVGFLCFYLLCGVAADFAHIAAAPDSAVPLVGASGAIAGVMGGYLLLYPKAEVDVLFIFIIIFRVFTFPAWIVLMLWFGLQIFNSAMTSADGGGVAYLAHAGGFVAGILGAAIVWRRRGGTAFWRSNDGHPPHPPQEVPEKISNIPVVRRRK